MNNYSDNEILNYLVKHGTLDLAVISNEIDMDNNKRYLAQHNYDIWQGKDGAYYTHLPDKQRTLLRRVAKESLEADIIKYYKSLEDKPTVRDMFYRWINEKLELGEITKGTYDRYENDFKRFFSESELSKIYIKTLQEDDLELFIRKTIASQKLSAKAYSGLRTILNGMLKYAKKKKYTEISISTFFKDLDISKKAFTNIPKSKEEQVFSEDEIPQLLEWLLSNPSIEHYGLILAFYTGMRTSELSALKFSDITENELHIQRQEITYKGEGRKNIHEVVEYTKTEAGNRYIILPSDVMPIIQQIRNCNPSGEYMFMVHGRRVWKNTFNDRLYSACDSVGIARRSMHKIRKTYGTTLINSGVDEALIMNQMGHADIMTTKKYYYFANKNRIHNQEQIEHAVKFLVKS